MRASINLNEPSLYDEIDKHRLLRILPFLGERILLPNLSKLTFVAEYAPIYSHDLLCYASILSPSLRDLTVRVFARDSSLKDFLEIVVRRSPYVKRLALGWIGELDDQDCFEPISRLKSLQCLQISADELISDINISFLRFLPHLHTIGIVSDHFFIDEDKVFDECFCMPSKLPSSVPFSTLLDLQLLPDYYWPTSCSKMFGIVPSVEALGVRPHMLGNLAKLRQNAASCSDLTIKISEEYRSSDEPPLFAADLKQLFAFENLTSLKIPNCGFENDRELLLILKSRNFRRMKHLSLTTGDINNPQCLEEGEKKAKAATKGLTIKCLPLIARRMRHLEHLEISLVASNTSNLKDRGAYFRNLEEIVFKQCFPNYRFPGFDIQLAGEFVGGLLLEDVSIYWIAGVGYSHTPYSKALESTLSDFTQTVLDTL